MTFALVPHEFFFFKIFQISAKFTFHSSPEKKQAASKSPPPTFQAKKSKAGEELKGPNQVSDPPVERY
jgi:hypothetical protein